MITKEMTIRQVLEKDINSAEIFLDSGMHCIGALLLRGNPSRRPAVCTGLMQMSLWQSSTSFLENKGKKLPAGSFFCLQLEMAGKADRGV